MGLFYFVAKGFIPDEDLNQVFAVTETAQGTSFDERVKLQGKVADIIRQDPNVEAFFSGVGGAGSASQGGQNLGRMFFHLVPRRERKLPVEGVIQSWRRKLADIPGINVYFQIPPVIRLGGQLTKSLYQFSMQSPDLDELYRMTPVLEDKLRQLPELQDVTSNLQIKNPQVNVIIDRDKASAIGITPQQIENALANAYSQNWISTIYAQNNQYRVLLELEDQYKTDPALMSKLYVGADSGKLVRLDSVTTLTRDVGPQAITHLGQLPATTISFNLRPGVSLGDAVNKVQAVARETLPATMSTSFQGTAQAFQSSLTGMGMLLVLSIVFIYIVLGILYESFVHPITILSGLPSAGFGALLTLMLFRLDLNVYSFVGLIMLIGIVKKNAIMQIDFTMPM